MNIIVVRADPAAYEFPAANPDTNQSTRSTTTFQFSNHYIAPRHIWLIAYKIS